MSEYHGFHHYMYYASQEAAEDAALFIRTRVEQLMYEDPIQQGKNGHYIYAFGTRCELPKQDAKFFKRYTKAVNMTVNFAA